jgi:DNA-binding NarL/FixJ family response regulator
MPIRVLVVDDHPVMRSGLLALLTEASGFESAGEAHDGIAALAMVRQTRPDVVLMDLAMPHMSGVEATRRITASSQAPPVAVLVLTMSDDDSSLAAAVRAGARGYLLKDASADEVLAAVRAVARGEVVFGRGVAPAVLDLLQARHRAPDRMLPELTDREREILGLVGVGLGNQAIAARLRISAKTVANTVSNILVKLGAADRGEAVAAARQAGLDS